MASPELSFFDAEAFLSKAASGRAAISYLAGTPIFTQGDAALDVCFVKQGSVKITVLSRRGKEAVIGIMPAGHFFGESVLKGQLVRTSTAVAMDDTIVIRKAKGELVALLQAEPAFAELFIAHLLSRNLRIEEDLVDQLFNSSEKRLARTLLLLANFGKEGRPETVIPNISQEMLAEIVGTTRSRVSFFMNKFRKLGFIEYNGKLHVHSSLLNVVLHD